MQQYNETKLCIIDGTQKTFVIIITNFPIQAPCTSHRRSVRLLWILMNSSRVLKLVLVFPLWVRV